MSKSVSVRLDDAVRRILEDEARARHIRLSAYSRAIATAEARRLRAERIRAQSEKVAAYIASSPEARAFYDDWGSGAMEIK